MIKIRSHKVSDIPYRVRWLNNPLINKFIGEQPGQKNYSCKAKKVV